MSASADEMATEAQVYGIWTHTVAELMSYRYLGCRSVLGDGFEARGEMTLRSDMRHEGSLLAAPVAIAMLDTAGIAVDRHWQLALTHIDVHLAGNDSGVARLGVLGSMTRQARSQVFTEATFVDADQSDVVLGFGTADWAVIDSTPSGFEYIDPGPGVQDTGSLPALATAYDARPRSGGGFVIDELTPRLGGFVLHHGPILVTLEAAAFEVGGVDARVEQLSVRIVKAGKRGPFFARASVLSESADVVLVRADLHGGDDGANLIATATVRLGKTVRTTSADQ